MNSLVFGYSTKMTFLSLFLCVFLMILSQYGRLDSFMFVFFGFCLHLACSSVYGSSSFPSTLLSPFVPPQIKIAVSKEIQFSVAPFFLAKVVQTLAFNHRKLSYKHWFYHLLVSTYNKSRYVSFSVSILQLLFSRVREETYRFYKFPWIIYCIKEKYPVVLRDFFVYM